MWDLIVLIPDHCFSIYFKYPITSYHKTKQKHSYVEIANSEITDQIMRAGLGFGDSIRRCDTCTLSLGAL